MVFFRLLLTWRFLNHEELEKSKARWKKLHKFNLERMLHSWLPNFNSNYFFNDVYIRDLPNIQKQLTPKWYYFLYTFRALWPYFFIAISLMRICKVNYALHLLKKSVRYIYVLSIYLVLEYRNSFEHSHFNIVLGCSSEEILLKKEFQNTKKG